MMCLGFGEGEALEDEGKASGRLEQDLGLGTGPTKYVCLLLQDLYKSCARGGSEEGGDVCFGMLRAGCMYVYYCRTYIKAVRGEGW